MIDFDYEILAAVALYGSEGVERKTLEREHFPQFSLDYNLAELAKPQIDLATFIRTGIKLTWANSAYLKVRAHQAPAVGRNYDQHTYEFFSLTDKGRAMLNNWQRQKQIAKAAARRDAQINWAISFTVGVVSGIAATFICSAVFAQ